MIAGTPVIGKVMETTRETPTIVSLRVKLPQNTLESVKCPVPGEFAMVWVPGLDEIPLSIAQVHPDNTWQLTVKDVGETTHALVGMDVGSSIGVRGPYGNGFSIEGTNPIIVGGGVGMAPLLFLIHQYLEIRPETRPTVVVAATTREELLFLEQMRTLEQAKKIQLECSTDDGTCGYCGMAHECLEAVIDQHKEADMLYCCGPEKMMAALFRFAQDRGLPYQASLERMMRCGSGICGLCVLDPIGVRVCREGPVFNEKILAQVEDFGRYKRTMTGKKVPL